MAESSREVLNELAQKGQEIMLYERVTVEQHEFIQDVYLVGQGNVAQQRIEPAMGFTRMGTIGDLFKELKAREKHEGQTTRYGRARDVFVEHRRSRPDIHPRQLVVALARLGIEAQLLSSLQACK
jgi:hypothetical protein